MAKETTRTRRARAEPFGVIVPELPPERQRELFPRTARSVAFAVMWGLLLSLLAVLGLLVAHHLSSAGEGGDKMIEMLEMSDSELAEVFGGMPTVGSEAIEEPPCEYVVEG